MILFPQARLADGQQDVQWGPLRSFTHNGILVATLSMVHVDEELIIFLVLVQWSTKHHIQPGGS